MAAEGSVGVAGKRPVAKRTGRKETVNAAPDPPKTISVFVLLGHGFGAQDWTRRYLSGSIPGLNERLAYGYYHAAGDGWSIEYSEDANETWFGRQCRLALRKVLGFDLIHAWRNRRGVFAADIVWTHTELENLAVLLLVGFYARARKPKIIANCVWLLDLWPRLSWIRKSVYRRLLNKAAAVTTFSQANLKVVKGIVPEVQCHYIPWGASVRDLKQPIDKQIHYPLRIASLGNDVHRDWDTVLEAFGNRKGYQVKIASTRLNMRRVARISNAVLMPARSEIDIQNIYDWTDIVVVAVKPNLHASGITVILEAVILGIPVVCTDCEGLRCYFPNNEIRYVPASDPDAMRLAVDELAHDDGGRLKMVINAQRRMLDAEFTTAGFAERHRRLSEQLLAGKSRSWLGSGSSRDII